MKTQVTKNKKSFNVSDQLIVVSFPFIIILSLLFLGMVISTGKNVFTTNTNEGSVLNSINPIVQVQWTEQTNQEIEYEKLSLIIRKNAEKVEMELLMAEVLEYAVTEKEPEIIITSVSSGFIETDISLLDVREIKQIPIYGKNEYLEKLARKHYNEMLDFYALERKVKKFLVAEEEPKLALEDWMTDEKCWCTETTEHFALHQK